MISLIVDVQNVKLLMTPASHFPQTPRLITVTSDVKTKLTHVEWFINYRAFSILNRNRTVLIITRKWRNIFSCEWMKSRDRERKNRSSVQRNVSTCCSGEKLPGCSSSPSLQNSRSTQMFSCGQTLIKHKSHAEMPHAENTNHNARGKLAASEGAGLILTLAGT